MQDRIASLSEVQKRCLRLVAEGRTSKEIALQIELTPMTVDQYLHRAMLALGASNRRDAARLFVEGEPSEQFKRFEFKPDSVAEPQKSGILQPSTGNGEWQERRRWLAYWFPPIGGERHDLKPSQILSAIVRVAIATGGGAAALVAISYWLIRLFA